ncbi:hypothetical protein AA0116_g13503 [Alternaria tenuissima]|nr:hypothetical protein AA0116_g13503 [Alternaria tenuissima]
MFSSLTNLHPWLVLLFAEKVLEYRADHILLILCAFLLYIQPPNSLIKSIKASRAAYRRLGNSGLLVSNPILGGMHIGDPRWYDWVLDEKDSIALLKAAYDRGINTFWKYVFPALSLVLGLSRASVFQQVEASLRRLNTDYIDVLHIHRFDHHVPPEETMKALHDLVQMNKVRYLGASSMWAHEFAILQHTAEKNNWTKFVSMQNHYNLLYREEEREMIKYCNLTGWGPLAAGKLARPPDEKASTFRAINGGAYKDHNPAESEQIARRVHQIAVSRGVPMSHVALAWLNKRVVSPVIGLSSVERMDEVLDARALELSDEEESRLEDPYKAQPPQGHS